MQGKSFGFLVILSSCFSCLNIFDMSYEGRESQCQNWTKTFNIVPGSSWGSMPAQLHEQWNQHNCNEIVNGKVSHQLDDGLHVDIGEIPPVPTTLFDKQKEKLTVQNLDNNSIANASITGCKSQLSMIYATHNAQNGLANVLKTTLGALYLTRKFNIPLLVSNWPLESFENAFEPIANLMTVGKSHFTMFKTGSSMYIKGPPDGVWSLGGVLRDFFLHPNAIMGGIEREVYSWLRPSAQVDFHSKEYIKQNNISAATAVHVRRTDHNTPTTGERSNCNRTLPWL